jgi:X-Pro dipeptidyl-peptidase-like protein
MASLQQLSEIRDGMRIDWNVPITMDDGLVLRADVFRPVKDGQYPVLLTYGPYAKNLAFQDGYPSAWQRMAEQHPDVTADSSNKYQSWEVVDPEKWVPHDYACVRVDSRGAGCYRPATALACRCAARTTNMAAPAAASFRTSRTSSAVAARSCTTIRATARPPFLTVPQPCISAAAKRLICCCRSFRRKNRQAANGAGGNKF